MNAGAMSDLDSVFDIALPARPYPGLRPFAKDEWPIFFGRERMTDEVIARMIRQRLLVVHGDSGCGKSSLIRAGVLPRLEQEAARGGVKWRTCVTTPGDEPLKNLARAIAGLEGRHDEARIVELRRIVNCGCAGAPALAELLSRSNEHVCLLVDQFEEVFAHARHKGPQEASILIDLLIGMHALGSPAFCTVLTMRSEFLGACAQFNRFAETVNATQYLLPRMSHHDLMRAIREPASLFGGDVTLDLAERLIADAGGGQDQLPLIQHGLMVLYRDRIAAQQCEEGWRLTLASYQAEGDLERLLSDHADAVMQRALQASRAMDDRSRVVEDVFRALTDINAEGQAIRRPLKLSKLIAVTGAEEAVLRRILDVFRAEGVSFLRPHGSEPIDLNESIDISHETLIRCWRKVADTQDGWLIREFKNGLVWRSLLVQADSFERDNSNILSAATTEERETWLRRRNPAWCERYGGGWERVCRLIDASAAERRRQKQFEEAERLHKAQTEIREYELQSDLKIATVRAQRGRLFRWGFFLVLILGAAAAVQTFQARVAREQAMQAAQAAQRSEAKTRLALQQAEDKRRTLEEATGRLSQVQEEVRLAAEEAPKDSKLSTQLAAAQSSLAVQLQTFSAAARVAPRIYFHISDESQRPSARELRARVEQLSFGREVITVPRVELKSAKRSALRCFRASECEEGRQLMSMINEQLVSPVLVLEDLSARYGALKNLRARHYELWFAPGAIVLKSMKAANLQISNASWEIEKQEAGLAYDQ